ncbi:MAG: AgmX/PglI C-terminal domain-containing protein [Bdellovibrionota bacterium]
MMMALELNFEIPGQIPQKVALDQPTMMAGTLASNHIVLRAAKVDPIHALFESDNHGNWTVTDLGSEEGVKVNGNAINVESPIKVGDSITIGSVNLILNTHTEEKVVGAFEEQSLSEKVKRRKNETVINTTERRADKAILFSPRDAKPSGDVLECVAYWGNTILEVEHFQKGVEGYEKITIGDPTKAHFIAAGKENIESYTLASIEEKGYKLNLRNGMEARLRKGGKVEKVNGSRHKMGRRDIAHIKYGAVRYFLLYVRPPALNLPKSGPRDTLFVTLMSVAMFFYFIFIPTIWLMNPVEKDDDKDDIWSIVHTPETERPEKKIEKEKKPQVKVAEVKTNPEPQKVPPPPKPKPVKPVKPIEKEKPKQPVPVEKPAEKPLNKLVATPKNQNKPPVPKPQGSSGIPSTGAKNPDMRLAGPKLANRKLGKAGGALGGGMGQKGGVRKGNDRSSVKGVEGVNNKKASGVNLGQLGLGAGLVIQKTGAGAVRTDFKSSAGGAGGGSGSGSKTLGLGGLGKGVSVGIEGTGNAINNFGSGSGGFGSGEGGSGGLGDKFGSGRGRSQVSVNIPVSTPAVSGGLTSQEVLSVIRTHLNEIRHCYEQLLQRSPQASGKISANFVIGLSGVVKSVKVINSSISDARMQGCVTGSIKRWKFPKPRGGSDVSINYPFVFNPL